MPAPRAARCAQLMRIIIPGENVKVAEKIILTENANLLNLINVTKNDAKFIRAGRMILGLSQLKFASMLKVDLAALDALENMTGEANGSLCDAAFLVLLNRGVANPGLLRAARGLIGQTQDELARNAEIAPGTYRRLEKVQWNADKLVRSSGSLAKLIAYLVSQGISMIFTEQTGAGVCLRGLLEMPELPGIHRAPHVPSRPNPIQKHA